MNREYSFTSESVSNGHPDKIADQISDAILDAYLREDNNAKVACEVLITDNLIVISGEFKKNSPNSIDVEKIARDVLRDIGYEKRWGFDPDECKILSIIKDQCEEITKSVEKGEGKIGAGDQGLMFGYATNETPEYMPLPLVLAHRLMIEHYKLRRTLGFEWLGPDAKSQVTVRYKNNKPLYVESVVLSTLHVESYENKVEKLIREHLIDKVIPKEIRSENFELFINPGGSFTQGGPKTDTGLTGRKIVVDTYGGFCPNGGGCFSGKDATKVDRSASYMARFLAKNIVASGYAEKCSIQIAYAIGQTKPVSFMVNFHNTGKGRIDEQTMEKIIIDKYDLSPSGIINKLKLRTPIYQKTAAFGHFGREEFEWEKFEEI
ncbi:MAG: methionine adenosyltransferase [Ignavibacteria bacterium]|nr:methionine adenosyltransferase [Ignavibacteria bacterium]